MFIGASVRTTRGLRAGQIGTIVSGEQSEIVGVSYSDGTVCEIPCWKLQLVKTLGAQEKPQKEKVLKIFRENVDWNF